MVVIFGWGGGNTKDLGEIAPATCPRCHNQVFLHHVRSSKEFSLYFVPITSYGGNEYLLCPICQHGLPVRQEQQSLLMGMGSATRLYRRGGLPAATYQAQVANFWAHMGVDAGGNQVVRAATTIPAPATPGPDAGGSGETGGAAGSTGPALADQLAQLATLRDEGVLTEEEFAAGKRRLLGG